MERGAFAILQPDRCASKRADRRRSQRVFPTISCPTWTHSDWKRAELGVFGNDYDTPDGTGVRDYIHVVDLARGHVSALKAIINKWGLTIYNLGTGQGYSVLDVINTFEKVNKVKVPYSIKPRRPGDIATCYSDPSKAWRELGWKSSDWRRWFRTANWQCKNRRVLIGRF